MINLIQGIIRNAICQPSLSSSLHGTVTIHFSTHVSENKRQKRCQIWLIKHCSVALLS